MGLAYTRAVALMCPRVMEAAAMATISWTDFEKVELRVGRIVRVEDFPRARKPAYKLWIDFGPLGMKRSSAQLTALYRKEDLMGRHVVAVTNFAPKQVADFQSEVLVTGVAREDGAIVLLALEREAPLGARVV